MENEALITIFIRNVQYDIYKYEITKLERRDVSYNVS